MTAETFIQEHVAGQFPKRSKVGRTFRLLVERIPERMLDLLVASQVTIYAKERDKKNPRSLMNNDGLFLGCLKYNENTQTIIGEMLMLMLMHGLYHQGKPGMEKEDVKELSENWGVHVPHLYDDVFNVKNMRVRTANGRSRKLTKAEAQRYEQFGAMGVVLPSFTDDDIAAQNDPNRKPKTVDDMEVFATAKICPYCASDEADITKFRILKEVLADPTVTTQGDVIFWTRIGVHKSHSTSGIFEQGEAPKFAMASPHIMAALFPHWASEKGAA
jgi:hypothetical protein